MNENVSMVNSVELTPELIENFLGYMKEANKTSMTIECYRRYLNELYDFLDDEKIIAVETVTAWREGLRNKGYANSSINLRISAVNSLLRYTSGYTMILRTSAKSEFDGEKREITRPEYLSILATAKKNGRDQEYLLIKCFASVNLNIRDLVNLTVDACKEGSVVSTEGNAVLIPQCICKELLAYAARRHITEGPVFITRNGNVLDRSNITKMIHNMARESGIPQEKCSPRTLHRLYNATKKSIEDKIRPIYLETYDKLLANEQTMIGWDRE